MNELFKNKKYQILILILLLIFAAVIAAAVLVSSSDEDDESISNNEPTSSPVSPPAVISDAGNVEDDDTDQDSRTDEATSEEVVIPAFPSEDSVHPKQEETWKTYKDPLSGFEISYPSDWELDDTLPGRAVGLVKDENVFEIGIRKTESSGCGAVLTPSELELYKEVRLSGLNKVVQLPNLEAIEAEDLLYSNFFETYELYESIEPDSELGKAGFSGKYTCEILSGSFGYGFRTFVNNIETKDEFQKDLDLILQTMIF